MPGLNLERADTAWRRLITSADPVLNRRTRLGGDVIDQRTQNERAVGLRI